MAPAADHHLQYNLSITTPPPPHTHLLTPAWNYQAQQWRNGHNTREGSSSQWVCITFLNG